MRVGGGARWVRRRLAYGLESYHGEPERPSARDAQDGADGCPEGWLPVRRNARRCGMRHLGIPVQHRRAVPLGLHQIRAHWPRHPNRAVGHRIYRDAALHGDSLLINR